MTNVDDASRGTLYKAEYTCWRLVADRLPFDSRARLALTSKALAALALAEITCCGGADLRVLAGSAKPHRYLSDRYRGASRSLLSLVRLAGPDLVRLRILARSDDLQIGSLAAALEGASELQELVVSPAPAGEDAVSGAPPPPESAFSAAYDCCMVWEAAAVEQLYASHPKLSRAVLTISAGSLAACPEVGRLRCAELTLLSGTVLERPSLYAHRDECADQKEVLSPQLLLEVLRSGGFRTVCVHVSPSESEEEQDPLAAGLAAALNASKVQQLALTVRGEAGRERVMRPLWAALRSGWAPRALRLGGARRGDMSCAAAVVDVDADAAAAGIAAVLLDAGSGRTLLGPAEFEISSMGGDDSNGSSGWPPNEHDAHALRPFLSAARRLHVNVPYSSFLGSLFSKDPAKAPFQVTLETLSLADEKGIAIVRQLMPLLPALRHLDLGVGSRAAIFDRIEIIKLGPILEAALATGRPSSSLRVGNALPVKVNSRNWTWSVVRVVDEGDVKAAAARLLASLDLLELGLCMDEDIHEFLKPLVAALKEAPAAGAGASCCGLRPGTTFRFGADIQKYGDAEFHFAFEVASPAAPENVFGVGGGGSARLVVHDMSDFMGDCCIGGEDSDDEGPPDPGPIRGDCLVGALMELVRVQPRVRWVDIKCGDVLDWYDLRRMNAVLETAVGEPEPTVTFWQGGEYILDKITGIDDDEKETHACLDLFEPGGGGGGGAAEAGRRRVVWLVTRTAWTPQGAGALPPLIMRYRISPD